MVIKIASISHEEPRLQVSRGASDALVEEASRFGLLVECEDRVKLPSEHAEEVEEQIPPERIGGHLQAEEVEYKVQLISDVSTGHIFSLDF